MGKEYEVKIGMAYPNPGGEVKMVRETIMIDPDRQRESLCDFLGCEEFTFFRIDYPIFPGKRSNGNVGLFVVGRNHCISKDYENDYNPYFSEDELTCVWRPDQLADPKDRRHPQRVFGPIIFIRSESESLFEHTLVDLYEHDEEFIELFLETGFSIPDMVNLVKRKERLEKEAKEAEQARKENEA